jgi:hypothetical protein
MYIDRAIMMVVPVVVMRFFIHYAIRKWLVRILYCSIHTRARPAAERVNKEIQVVNRSEVCRERACMEPTHTCVGQRVQQSQVQSANGLWVVEAKSNSKHSNSTKSNTISSLHHHSSLPFAHQLTLSLLLTYQPTNQSVLHLHRHPIVAIRNGNGDASSCQVPRRRVGIDQPCVSQH